MRWGPLGWITLHSIAAIYPEQANAYEKELFRRWLVSFQETILCPSCSKHFGDMLSNYGSKYPTWTSTRRGVVEFVLRAHNTVNARLQKPVYSLENSVQELERVFPETIATQKRREYLMYIRGDWMKNMTMAGVSTAPKLKELFSIEENYWAHRPLVWSSLLQYAGSIQISPLVEQLSTLNSTPNIPKIIAPAQGYSLLRSGKIGRLSSLR
jgi:hypothetical protein